MAEKLTFKTCTIEYIIEWCKKNDQVDWLKEIASQTTKCEVYPRKKVQKLDENGKPVLNKKGKPAMIAVADKTQLPTIEERPISFMEIRQAFFEKFMPEYLPKAKTKKLTMYDTIANL